MKKKMLIDAHHEVGYGLEVALVVSISERVHQDVEIGKGKAKVNGHATGLNLQ